MGGGIRTIVGVCLVLLIVAIVVSPYVDLPLTTLSARQAAPWLLAAAAAAVKAATLHASTGAGRMPFREQRYSPNVRQDGVLTLTCSLLC